MTKCEICGNDYDRAFEVDRRQESPCLRQLRMRDTGAGAGLLTLWVPHYRARRGGKWSYSAAHTVER